MAQHVVVQSEVLSVIHINPRSIKRQKPQKK
jgi:hypothetical protein